MNLKIGEELNGFRLKNFSEVEEIGAKTYEFEHEKTGAKLFYVATDDDNKVFYIGFRTPPKDDTGVNTASFAARKNIRSKNRSSNSSKARSILF